MITNDERGVTNIFAKEPPLIMSQPRFGFTEFAERLNGRAAMIGIVAALLNYYSTGQILPGIW